MPVVLIFLALLLLDAAWQNTQAQLVTQLGQDVTGFGKWFAALALVSALQWIPGLEKPARWLLGLVLLVLVLTNYKQIFAGFADIASGSGTAPAQTTAAGSPAAATATTAGPAAAVPASAIVGGAAPPIIASPYGQFSPQSVVSQFASNIPGSVMSAALMGFGGVA
jgi:hypothetical protein